MRVGSQRKMVMDVGLEKRRCGNTPARHHDFSRLTDPTRGHPFPRSAQRHTLPTRATLLTLFLGLLFSDLTQRRIPFSATAETNYDGILPSQNAH